MTVALFCGTTAPAVVVVVAAVLLLNQDAYTDNGAAIVACAERDFRSATFDISISRSIRPDGRTDATVSGRYTYSIRAQSGRYT